MSRPLHAAAPPSASALLKNARALQPVFKAQSAASEAQGKLTDEAFGAMRDAGLLGLQLPACFGGTEASTIEALEVLEAVSYADGSAGWVLMASQVATCLSAVCLPDAAAKEIFGAATPEAPVVMAGQGAPNGRAVVDGNGYRLTGQWNYASGILHSQYTHGGAFVVEKNGAMRMHADGRPQILSFVVPTSKAKVGGNWEVMGLRATGSVDYSISDTFVPEEYTHAPEAVHRYRGGNFYAMGIFGMTTLGHTGFIIGIGRRILDELVEVLGDRPARRGGMPPLSATPGYHEGYGHAEARYRSSRAFIFDVWGELQKSLDRGDAPGIRQFTLIRLALNHATSEIAEVATWAYKMGGGVALRESVLQRCFRDTYAATQHFFVSPTMLQECGRELAGMAKGEQWTVLGLRKPG